MLERQIYLIGMPGSGKSSLGRRAARELGLPFTDLDQWIEERAGMSVSDIFAQHGETAFRKAETGALAALTRARPGVISLGGGTAMNPVNRKIMQSWGSVILLDRPLERILSDIRTEERPLLQENPEEKLRELYETRMPVYRQLADVVLPNAGEYTETLSLLERVLKERYHA
ncbi:MAG: shikimate kinase [Clostridia bacterium]|nr:shikimate kinase [Clostridia bacterium]